MFKHYPFSTAVILVLFAFACCASEQTEVLRHNLIERVATDSAIPILLEFGAGAPESGTLRKSGAREFQVQTNGGSMDMRWADISDSGMYRLFTPSTDKASPETLVAYLELGISLRRTNESEFRKALEFLRVKNAVAASAVDARLADPNRALNKGGVIRTPGVNPVETTPVTLSGIPENVGLSSKLTKPSRARYGLLSHPADVAALDELLGSRTDTSGSAKRPAPNKDDIVPMAPIAKSLIGAKTPYNFGTPSADPGPYWCTQGQALYIPDKPNDAGVDRIHVGAYGNHMLQFVPIPAWWGGSHPEPGVKQKEWSALAGGSLGQPFFIDRAYSSFSENGFMIFNSGLIGAGSVNNVPKYPCFRFPADKWPTALALTNKNEFLLVAVWDAKEQKAQMAVLALGLTENGKTGYCLPNWGIHNLVKLLGYVDLPGLELPTAIACTAASNPFAAAPAEAWNYDYSSPENRKRYFEDSAIASAGYAVIVSKVGNNAAFIDLKPLLNGIRKNCFTSAELAAKARIFGDADSQWPYTFKHAPEMRPTLITTLNVPAPTAVRTSMREAHGRPAIAAIACEKGEVRIYRVGGLLTEKVSTAADIQPHALIQVGANPCALAHQRYGDPTRIKSQGEGVGSWDSINYVFLVCCRGSQEIDWIEVTPKGGECYRRFRDTRIVDPVHVQQMRVNSGDGAYVFTVCDFKGRKIINYRIGAAHIDGKDIPIASGAPIECTGWMEFPGYPFMVSADNVP